MSELDKMLLYCAELAGDRYWFSLLSNDRTHPLIVDLINQQYITHCTMFREHPQPMYGGFVMDYEITRAGRVRLEMLASAPKSE